MVSPSTAVAGLVALEHVYILTLEMFLWQTPRGLRTFKLEPEFARKSASLAANMGLYNGFLAAGLGWGLVHPVGEFGDQIRTFFLGLVAVAGAYGGATVGPRIAIVQMVPAVLGLGLTYLGL
ncbi:hypothetical protein N3K66_007669 [Trichothecium roseum]|uniref:Uncharacterized protein n=1 Tax=Trichothecium roseum TaxID=47278 RepID=A0ACC0UUM7_9HYPO|nr:hypothetical protein N3K66_007669 [Trichothecium roseum]